MQLFTDLFSVKYFISISVKKVMIMILMKQFNQTDYYNDDFSDNDGYVSNGQDPGQHEVVQHAHILHIPGR